MRRSRLTLGFRLVRPPVCALQKTILKSGTVTIPAGVTVEVKARKLVCKGPRGTLTKDLSHLPVDIKKTDETTIVIERWFTSGKAAASIRTACSHIDNMIIGVTKVRRRLQRSSRAPLPCVRPRGGSPRPARRSGAAAAARGDGNEAAGSSGRVRLHGARVLRCRASGVNTGTGTGTGRR